MKRLSRVLLAVFAMTVPTQAAYHALRCVQWGELSDGRIVLQLRLTVVLTEDEQWRGASCEIQTMGGDPITFYQSLVNDFNPPYTQFFQPFPDSRYTSFYTAPHLWPNTATSAPAVAFADDMESPDHLSATWYADSPTVGPGEFVIAQFTLIGAEGHGLYQLSVTSTLKPGPTITSSDSFYTPSFICDTLSSLSVSFGPWAPGENSTTARIPREEWGWLEYDNAVIEGEHAADFTVVELPWPGDAYEVKFHPTDYGYRSATLVLTGRYQDYWMTEPVPWTVHVPLSGYGMCFGDLDGDSRVSLPDLAILLSNYGRIDWNLGYLDGNLVSEGGLFEFIKVDDLAELLTLYGTTCD